MGGAPNRRIEDVGPGARSDASAHLAYVGAERRDDGATPASLPVLAGFVVVTLAVVAAARLVPLLFDGGYPDIVGGFERAVDAVVIALAVIAMAVLYQRRRFGHTTLSAFAIAVLAVISLGLIPLEIAASESGQALAGARLGLRLALALVIATALTTPMIQPRLRLWRLLLASLLAAAALSVGLAFAPLPDALMTAGSADGGLPWLGLSSMVFLLLSIGVYTKGLRERELRYAWLGIAVACLGIADGLLAASPAAAIDPLAGKLVRLIGIAGLFYTSVVELSNAVLASRARAAQARLEASRTAERLLESMRLNEEVVHDARNAALAIGGGLSIIGNHDDPTLVAAIQAELHRLTSTLDAKNREAEARSFDVAATVDSMVACYAASAVDVELVVDGQPWAYGRPVHLAESVQNLIDNALRHAAGSQITIWIGATPNLVHVRVSDTGPGIDPAIAGRIFDRGQSTSGTGLGLSVTQRLVEDDGGSIEVMARHGGGTIFAITYPAGLPQATGSTTLPAEGTRNRARK